jgi:DNA-binding NtrC family response regulator
MNASRGQVLHSRALVPTHRLPLPELVARVVRTCDIVVLDGPDAGTRVRLDRARFHIGTQRNNDLVLSDHTVSKQHLELTVEAHGYRVTDLDSRNGTWLGAARIGELTVREPVTLRLGATLLRIAPTDEEAEVPASTSTAFGTLLGQSVAMRELFAQLASVAPTDCSVLLEGETGVGKEHVAEALHQQSARAAKRFVVVDCGALVGELMEAELFGYVHGAFSGAAGAREGLLASASGGTLFLDEIGELSLPLQAKLLGAIERRRIVPLGSSTPRPIDVRIIAATTRNLGREMNRGCFRVDLFYRLAVARLRVPPLRERKEDIPLLVRMFLGQLRARYGERVPAELPAVALDPFATQSWPGNVRELRNVVERMALAIAEERPGSPAVEEPAEPYCDARERFLADFERQYLLRRLEQTGFNVTQAARHAGVDLRYFRRLLQRHGLSTPSSSRSRH